MDQDLKQEGLIQEEGKGEYPLREEEKREEVNPNVTTLWICLEFI